MLFLHGSADTNVPIGESIQMFTALKLLGRPTAFVVVSLIGIKRLETVKYDNIMPVATFLFGVFCIVMWGLEMFSDSRLGQSLSV